MKQIVFLFCLFIFTSSCNSYKDGKTLTQAIDEFPAGLDPTVNFGIDEKQIYAQIYEPLLQLDQDYRTIIPKLAENWQVSANSDTITFKLKYPVYFHDGSILSSYSVKHSLDWLKSQNKQSDFSEQIKEIIIKDSLHFKIVLVKHSAVFIYSLASPLGLMIFSERALAKYDKEIAIHPTGTGPFRLDHWSDSDEIHLSPFGSYWGKRSNLAGLTFKFYDGAAEKEEALSQGKADILYTVSAYSVDRLKWFGKIEYHTQLPAGIFFLGFNNAVYPFNDIRVRKAILHALNIPKLVFNVNRGNAEVAKGPLPPMYVDYKNFNQAGYDLNLAKKLLQEAGVRDELTVNFDFPLIAFTRRTLVEILKSELSKVGIKLKVRLHNSWADFDASLQSDSTQMFINGGTPEVIGDAGSFLFELFHSKSGFNTLNYHDQLIDQLLFEAQIEADPYKRRKIYNKVVQKALDDTPAVFLYHVIPHFAYNSEKIKKMVTNSYGIIEYHKVELN